LIYKIRPFKKGVKINQLTKIMKTLISYLTISILILATSINGNVKGHSPTLTEPFDKFKYEGKTSEFEVNSPIVKTEVPKVSTHDVKLINKSEFTKMACERESRGKYNVANEFKYLGKYQMGKIALRDIGYSDARIDSMQSTVYTILNSKGKKLYYFDINVFPPSEQEIAICKYFHKIEKRYLKKDIEKYVGKTIDGVYITKAGILGASMLGCGYVNQFLKSNGKKNPTDAYGTSVKSRLLMFQDFELNGCY
jgi:hypothetical protein